MLKYLKYCFLFICLQSCIEEVPIVQISASPKTLVIHSFIHPDSFLNATVSEVSQITSSYIWINDANLTILSKSKGLFSFNGNGNGKYAMNQNFLPNDSLKFQISHSLLTDIIPIKIPSRIHIKRLDTFTTLISNVGKTKAYRIYFKDSAYNTNFYRIYGVRHFKKYTIDAVLGKVDSFLYEDKLPIGGTEVCFTRNSYNNYTTKEILFSDEIINGTELRLEFYETLPRAVSNAIVLYQIDIYLENIDVNIFNYLNSRNAHIWQQNSITQLPTSVIGNIVNGFGVVGGYTNDVIRIKLKN
jgi:hypothetical protein